MPLTEIDVANGALNCMGFGMVLQGDVDGTFLACTDTSLERTVVERWYTKCRDLLLEEWPWTFARKVALLTLADDLTDDTDIWGQEWGAAFEYPEDCARTRRFVGDSTAGRGGDWCTEMGGWPWPGKGIPFVVRVQEGAKVILTDVAEVDANLEYTEKVVEVERMTPSFISALEWYIAHKASLPLRVSAEASARAYSMFRSERWAAKAADHNEENPRPEPDGPLIAARRGR